MAAFFGAGFQPPPKKPNLHHPPKSALERADPHVLRLLAHDPFHGRAPEAVRIRRERYRYTTAEERRATGDWWVREPG